MDAARLRYMAGQIAREFAVQGDEVAIEATADHIRKFWDPRMRAQLLADNPAGQTPMVAAIVTRLRVP